jgi:hypothetical protein
MWSAVRKRNFAGKSTYYITSKSNCICNLTRRAHARSLNLTVVRHATVQVSSLPDWINKLGRRLLYKPAFTKIICIFYINIIIILKWRNAYVIHSTPGRCVSAGVLVRKWRLLRKTTPSPRRRGGLFSKHINNLGTSKNLVMGPEGAWDQRTTVLTRASSTFLYYVMFLICVRLFRFLVKRRWWMSDDTKFVISFVSLSLQYRIKSNYDRLFQGFKQFQLSRQWGGPV